MLGAHAKHGTQRINTMTSPAHLSPHAKASSSSTPGYFLLSREEMQRIDSLGGSHYEMASYIVLSCGINSRQGGRHSTHGAKSVQRRTGMSYRRAQSSIAWLIEHGFLWPADSNGLLGSQGSAGTSHEPIYLVSGRADRCTPVSQAFLSDGGADADSQPNLASLFQLVSGRDEMPRSRAVMDALLAYVNLLDAQDIGTFGGVDPAVWSYPLSSVRDETDPAVVEANGPLSAKGAAELVTIEAGEVIKSPGYEWLSKVLGGCSSTVSAEEPALERRFEKALNSLRTHRLVYDVIELWEGDPHCRSAEPWGTLYVSCKWARRSEPQAAFEVHEELWASGARDRDEDFAKGADSLPWLGTGQYRFFRPSRAHQHIHAIGQLRVRPWPSDEATVSGRKLDERRTQSYIDWIRRLAGSCPRP